MNPRDYQSKLNQLVEGTLDPVQKELWLRSLEDDSPQWRDIAIGFLENQLLDQALSDVNDLVVAPSVSKVTSKETSENRYSPKLNFTWWIALAASLLVGWLLGSQLASTPSVNPNQELASQRTETKAELDKPDTHKLQLSDALARSAKPISRDARRAFLKAGYIVNERQQMADVELPSGRSIQLPIREFDVRYLGSAAFQ